MTLDFTPADHAHCLYDEAIDLHALGHLSVRRASHIEFNDLTQMWGVRLAGDQQVVYRIASLSWKQSKLHG